MPALDYDFPREQNVNHDSFFGEDRKERTVRCAEDCTLTQTHLDLWRLHQASKDWA